MGLFYSNSARPRFIKLLFVLAVVVSIGSGLALLQSPTAVQAKPVKVSVSPSLTASRTPASVAPAQANQANTAPAPATAVSPIVPSCSPSGFVPAAAPAVSPTQPGLHTTVLPQAHYAVYGDTVDQVDGQMTACSPVHMHGSNFAASTNYAMAWTYNDQSNGDGTCSLSDVSVGVTVSQVFPAWQQTAGAAPGLAASWQAFITNLETHESVFVQSDQAAAANLLSDLQNLPATDCNSITAAVNAKTQADLAALNQANTNYDVGTGYGATQGAVLK